MSLTISISFLRLVAQWNMLYPCFISDLMCWRLSVDSNHPSSILTSSYSAISTTCAITITPSPSNQKPNYSNNSSSNHRILINYKPQLASSPRSWLNGSKPPNLGARLILWQIIKVLSQQITSQQVEAETVGFSRQPPCCNALIIGDCTGCIKCGGLCNY